MRVIKSPRGTGKSTEIIKLSNKTQNPILVLSESRRRNIQDLAERMGISNLEIYTVDELKRIPHFPKPFLIDDCDQLLESLLQIRIYGISTC